MSVKMKRLGACLLAVLLLLSALSLVVGAEAPTTTIRIVHTNDLHGYYSTAGGGIGFSALKAVIKAQAADLVLDAGDTFHGQAFATVEQGGSMAELLRAVGYDATTPGNHDWSYGAQRLKTFDTQRGFSVLAANVVDANGDPYFTPYLVKEVEADDGTVLRIGVLGVIDDAFYTSTLAENVEGLRFLSEAPVAAAVAETLRTDEHCDIVIALTHQADCAGFVGAVSGVDAVIAGHEHKQINESYPDATGKPVPVVEAGYYFKNVGVLSLTYSTAEKKVVSAAETFLAPSDTASLHNDAVDAIISRIEMREEVILRTGIGRSDAAYPYSWEDVRVAEQPIGRIVTAAYLDWTGADVAFENAGGIRGGIPSGDVTYRDLISISPYGNILVVKELTGRQILDVIEFSLEINRACDEIYTLQKEAVKRGESPQQYSWPDNSGSALQVGGIVLSYDMSRPAGSRIEQAYIGGKPLVEEQIYRVATNNYVSENTKYPAIAEATLLSEYGTCEEALRRYIAKGDFEAVAASANLSPASEWAQEPETSVPGTGADSTLSPQTAPTLPGNNAPATGDVRGATAGLLLLTFSGAALLAMTKHRKKR